jgi:hypothetical protein
MACCDWQTFEEGFLGEWDRAKHSPSKLLIDWKLAKKYWSRYHCTGGEAARVQLKVLSKECEYLWIEKFNKKRGDDGGLSVMPLPEPMLL